MWDIKYIIKDLIQTKSAQDFINNRFKSATEVVISRETFKVLCTEQAKFYLCGQSNMVHQAVTEYDYHDLRSSDVVLDIGANIGGFSLNVFNRVKKVYAVEPIMTDELRKNIALNSASNVTVLECGLGDGAQYVEWNHRKKMVTCERLSEIINKCGEQIDFLKCDCEGGEWCITPPDLNHIRRIEAEIHTFNGERLSDFEDMLTSAGYKFSLTHRSKQTAIVHATLIQ